MKSKESPIRWYMPFKFDCLVAIGNTIWILFLYKNGNQFALDPIQENKKVFHDTDIWLWSVKQSGMVSVIKNHSV